MDGDWIDRLVADVPPTERYCRVDELDARMMRSCAPAGHSPGT